MLGWFVLLLAVTLGGADVYMHSPRGSNNRLNEKSANRANANRLFDSQNNNRGGYNAGDKTDKPAGLLEENQYRMKYFMSGPDYKVLGDGKGTTKLTIEWTNQHGCGGNEDSDPHKQNCQMVLQYMCQGDIDSATGTVHTDTFRNGVDTGTQAYTAGGKKETNAQILARRKRDRKLNQGEHESYFWYDNCYYRERNQGLFTADQKLDDNKFDYSSAIHTRQNPNGNRNGYECPEERDYYPYWHPTPWKDMAILAENATMCSYYKMHSFNVKSKFECIETDALGRRTSSRWNNRQDCVDNGGTWTELFNYLEKIPSAKSESACLGMDTGSVKYQWAVPYDTPDGATEQCLVKLDEPECYESPWSRSNHLGNGRDGVTNNYTWTIPFFPSGKTQRCVIRMRYNISTDDYDPYNTDARHNEDLEKNMRSPVEQNPYIEVGGNYPLRLAINTAQFGRTFQDRTHVFKLMKRPAGTERARIHNLNVRGKRGNIVQTYPAVEYDFVPNNLETMEEDLIHMQWTGSNTHNNGKPGGDGQTGDAGEGTGGTDRNNIVQVRNLNENYPVPYENSTMWETAEVVWMFNGQQDKMSGKDLAIAVASSGYFQCFEAATCTLNLVQSKAAMNNLLNNAPATFEGALVKLKEGEYHYICSRNNNFSNRSQKGKIAVKK